MVKLQWEPQLPLYFYFTFPTEYQGIKNAQFYFTINNLDSKSFQAIYFGNNDTNYYNTSFPSYSNSCPITMHSEILTSYSIVVNNPNAQIYIAFVAGSLKKFDLFVTNQFKCLNEFEYSSQQKTCVSIHNCTSEQYYDSKSQKCMACSSSLINCKTCTNSSECTSCINSGLSLSFGECVANCSNGYYTNPNLTATSINLCLPCMKNCFYCTNATVCYTCNYPFIWDSVAGKCVKNSSNLCKEGFYWNSTLTECVSCRKAINYCDLCQQDNYCIQCARGAIGGEIVQAKGICQVECSPGNYPNPDKTSTKICIPCLANCIQCSNSETCSECYEPTYTWNSESKKCESKCHVGWYYDENMKMCNECQVQYCVACYGPGGQCAQCKQGYRPVQSTSMDVQDVNQVCEKVEEKGGVRLGSWLIIIIFLNFLFL